MALSLAGVRILDLSVMLSGPYGTMLLADLGAEVIKVERPPEGDTARSMPPYRFLGESAYFLSVNRNKKSITLDLKAPGAREVFYDLVKQADVVWDNYRPGVLERLGIDYETLRQINPRIISCSVTGFGQTGAYRQRAAFDLVVQAMGGIMSYTGDEGGRPVRMGAPLGDLGGGIFAALGVQAALLERGRTGVGQQVDVGMLDAQVSLLIYRAMFYWLGGEIPVPIGAGHTSAVPIDVFRTRNVDIVIDANSQEIFQRLCDSLGRPEWKTDARFADRAARYQNKKLLLGMIQEVLLTRDGDEWLAILAEHSVPAGPVNTVDRVLADPHVLERKMVVEAQHANGERLRLLGNPIKLSAHPEQEFSYPPAVGEHTEAVLSGLLGYGAERIQALREQGVI